LTVQLPINSAINQGQNYLTAIATSAIYQWINCDTQMAIPGETNQVFVASVIGNYAVSVLKMDAQTHLHVFM